MKDVLSQYVFVEVKSLNSLLILRELHLSQDLINGEVIYSNLMSILMLGVKSVLEQRASQLYGPVLEEAVSLSFQIFIHASLKESFYAEACHDSDQVRHFNSLSSVLYVFIRKITFFILKN